MKKFSDLEIGDEFFSEFIVSPEEIDRYLSFSGIRNVIYDKRFVEKEGKIISGRGILAKMEGKFTQLDEIQGNFLTLYGIDGDPSWKNRQTRFLNPLFTDEKLKVKFKISDKRDLNDEYGLISIDFEGTKENGNLVVVSKKNLYQMKK